MAAPKGNEYYKLGDQKGRPKKYNTALFEVAITEYIDHVLGNPILVQSSNGTKIEKVRPMSIKAFCMFSNIPSSMLYSLEKKEEFSEIIGNIKDIIEVQQFEHATIGEFKENIIARKLGLIDKTESEVKVTGITPMTVDGNPSKI